MRAFLFLLVFTASCQEESKDSTPLPPTLSEEDQNPLPKPPKPVNPSPSKPKDDLKPLPVVEIERVDAMHTVMVIDTGFDVRHPIFEGKIEATYNISCDDTGDCQLKEGLSGNSIQEAYFLHDYMTSLGSESQLQATLDGSESWNNQIWGRELSIEDIKSKSEEIKQSGYYFDHGTGVAGLIAYKNPNVKLILVDLNNAGHSQENGECPSDARLDDYIAKVDTDEKLNAYAKRDLNTYEKAIFELSRKHQISIVNLSNGYSEPKKVKQSLQRCNNIDKIEKFFKLETRENEIRQNFLYEYGKEIYDVDHLVVQAAGNSGLEINDYQDSYECHSAPNHILVGSYDRYGQTSGFSNFGKCVDVFALGESLISPAVFGYYFVNSGTSYSAPNLVRYLTLSSQSKAISVDARIEEGEGERKRLKLSFLSSELFFYSTQQ